MSVYTTPILVAVLVFSIISVVAMIPWLIYSYRKYGFVSFSKTLIVFSFVLYFFAALFLVLLPLPETTNTCAIQKPNTVFYNFRPFQFVSDILYKSGIVLSQPATWLQTIKQPAFFQAFFNFLLLLPLGVYIRYYLRDRKNWWKAYLAGLGLSLFYEVTQVTGIYGIYNCPYRIFDVDDLMINSVGALFGFLVAPMILALLPAHKDIVQQASIANKERVVKPFQLLLAMAIDLIVIRIFMNIVVAFATDNIVILYVIEAALYAIVFWVIPVMLKGSTIGMKLLKFKMVDEATEQFSFKGITRRWLAIFTIYLIFGLMRVFNSVELNMDSPFYIWQIVITILSFAAVVILYLAIVIHIIRVLLARGKKQYFYDDLANMFGKKLKK